METLSRGDERTLYSHESELVIWHRHLVKGVFHQSAFTAGRVPVRERHIFKPQRRSAACLPPKASR